MRKSEAEEQRELLLEAFLGGWQAALGRFVRHPRALAVVEACFDLWLEEASDEIEILGLPFRRRDGLPKRATAEELGIDLHSPPRPPPPVGVPAGDEPGHGRTPGPAPVPVPRQRRPRSVGPTPTGPTPTGPSQPSPATPSPAAPSQPSPTTPSSPAEAGAPTEAG